MEQSALARAWEYLTYSPGAKWGAMLNAAASGASYVVLLLILGVFADLVVSRGEIPTYTDLSDAQRHEFHRDWETMPESDRRAALDALPAGLAVKERQQLATADDAADAMAGHWRWNAYVGWVLERRAGPHAASYFRDGAVSAESGHVQMGALSLAVRARHHPVSNVVAWLARWNPWLWQPSASGAANRPYLVGLLILALVVAAVRLATVAAMHHFAGHATDRKSTRLNSSH